MPALPLLLSPCSPPSPLHALALISLFLAKVRLSLTLTHFPLTIWCSGLTAVFFPFGNGGSGVLGNCSLCGTEATLSFLAGPVCSSFFAETCAFCKIFDGLGSTNKSATSLFLLSDSHSVLTTLSSPQSFLLPQFLWQELSSLSSCSIRLHWAPGHSFFPENDTADELARRGALLVPSAILCGLSPLISRIHSCLFSDWRRTVSSKFFDTQISSIFIEELVFPRHARCVLSRLRCNGHSPQLSSYLFRIGRIENPSCSTCAQPSQNTSFILFCTVQLRTFCVAHSLATLCLFTTSGVPGSEELPGFWGSMVFRHAPIPRKGSGNNNNNNTSFELAGLTQISVKPIHCCN